MADGFSLHVGVNRVDPRHYGGFDPAGAGGWEGSLRSCEQDAVDLRATAAAEGFAASTLLADAATVQAAGSAISEAAASLGPGDIFVLTYSGYGSQVPDLNSDEHWREATWALYDRQLPEDELTAFLGSFPPGARVLVIDDSSSAGTVRRSALTFLDRPLDESEPRTKDLPPDVANETYRSNRELYDEIQRSCTSSDQAVIPAAVLIITGFAENQLGTDGPRNGLFTETLLRVWDGGRFQGSYTRFAKEIAALMPPTQVPHLSKRGASKTFVRERPLTI